MKSIATLSFAFFMFIAFAAKSNMELPPLPEAVSNNAVASVSIDGQQIIFSFAGVPDDKKFSSIHNKVWRLDIPKDKSKASWQSMTPLPSLQKHTGRLATTALGVNDSVYIIGGYHSNRSRSYDTAPGMYKYHVPTDTYAQLEPIPVSVSDAVALNYRDRYIYVLSGWHNDGAVNLVQVYDIVKNEWFQATPFAGTGVFGHAGGIVDNVLMVCDGASVTPQLAAQKTISQQTNCYLGEINVTQPNKINWYLWVHPTDQGRFRMAATGDVENDSIVFVGGASLPHQINGISYNGKPAQPTSEVWTYHITKRSWKITQSPQAIMDVRGLIKVGDKMITLGGMIDKQAITNQVSTHTKSAQP